MFLNEYKFLCLNAADNVVISFHLYCVDDDVDGAVEHEHEVVDSGENVCPFWPEFDCSKSDHLLN